MSHEPHTPAGLIGDDRALDLIRRGAAIAETAPCHCVDAQRIDDPEPVRHVCRRCTFLADATTLEEALFLLAAAGNG